MSGLDEFKVVTRRSRKSTGLPRQVRRLPEPGREEVPEEPEIDIERVYRGVQAAVRLIENSNYGNILLNGLNEALRLLKVSDLPEILCYGLGNISQTIASKFQLAALLVIKSHYRSNVQVYDPLFFNREIEILKKFGIQTIESNEEAKRPIGQTTTSLIYMPHCPYQLTNNFIYANWKHRNLSNCIILSNSFGELVDSISFTRDLEESTNYIARLYPYTTEIELRNTFEYEQVFNGSSIHIFPSENLSRVDIDYWDNRNVPIYRVENCDFVRQTTVSTVNANKSV